MSSGSKQMNSLLCCSSRNWCLFVPYTDVLTDACLLPQCCDSLQGKAGKSAEFMVKSSVPYREEYLPRTTANFSEVLTSKKQVRLILDGRAEKRNFFHELWSADASIRFFSRISQQQLQIWDLSSLLAFTLP